MNETILWIMGYACMVGFIANFVLLLFYKLGIVEWLQVHGDGIMSQLATCDFCMSWWICVFLSVVLLSVTRECAFLVVPFIATPIARKLI